MNTHVSKAHEGKKEFKCANCSAEFTSKQGMKEHSSTIHEGKKQFKCGICNLEFTSKHAMKGHIAVIHEGKKQFNLNCQRLADMATTKKFEYDCFYVY